VLTALQATVDNCSHFGVITTYEHFLTVCLLMIAT